MLRGKSAETESLAHSQCQPHVHLFRKKVERSKKFFTDLMAKEHVPTMINTKPCGHLCCCAIAGCEEVTQTFIQVLKGSPSVSRHRHTVLLMVKILQLMVKVALIMVKVLLLTVKVPLMMVKVLLLRVKVPLTVKLLVLMVKVLLMTVKVPLMLVKVSLLMVNVLLTVMVPMMTVVRCARTCASVSILARIMCCRAGGSCQLLHQERSQAEGGVQEGEGEGPHQTSGHGLCHFPE